MADIGLLADATRMVFSWPNIMLILLGVLIGILGGALPGVGGALTVAIAMPFTLQMQSTSAIIFLMAIYNGVMYGGSISSILFNVPGDSSAAATTLEGYPMTKQGRAIDALTISALSSGLGDLFGAIVIILLMPVMVTLVLMFGTPEYFLVAIFGLSLIIVVSDGSFLKDMMAGGFGALIATVGVAPMSVTERYTFGMLGLYDGVNFVAALIGIFAISEMLRLSLRDGSISREGDVDVSGSVKSGVKKVISHPITLLKSSSIGLLVGAIPGSGGSVSTFIAYGEAKRASKDPDEFGSGAEDGVIATESANNATVSGALIPTLTFGIPGSTTTAVLIGALMLHGLRPGPALFDEQIGLTYSIFTTLILCGFVIIVFGLLVVRWAGYITTINTDLIIPIIVCLSLLGTYSLHSNYIDVFVVLIMGVVGYLMESYDYSLVAFLLGLILGPIAEENLYRSLQLSGGSFEIFLATPLRIALVVMILLVIAGPYVRPLFDQLHRQTTNQ
ncbi:tripartite tricarboxylate transporter permease [Haladaptatus caseinilyticus]|uniref:tripartite tricarboxylate transporter permease n=1 Tax=Haladaptatus caseinilyticus TaxID=2993314 RepID=UPI00224A5669|nr:tripartite tricarboxylate transporter permease [Haladaptatus caseinilyticus]